MSIKKEDLLFSTQNNYLKRHLLEEASHTVPGSFGGASGTFTHNLGYIPAVRVFYTVNGALTESYGNSQSIGDVPAIVGVYVTHRIDENEVTYDVINSGGSSRVVKVIALIYLDDLA